MSPLVLGAGTNRKVTFRPAAIPGLVGWYDATRIGGVADGANLLSWPDASGLGNTLSGTYDTGVTYIADPQGGTGIFNRPIVRFAGSGTMATEEYLFSGTSGRSIVVAYSHHGSGTFGGAIAGQSGDGSGADPTGSHFYLLGVGTGTVGDPILETLADPLAGPGLDWESWRIAEASYDGVTARVFRDGEEITSEARTLATDGLYIFRVGASNQFGLAEFLDGDIGEIMVFDHDLTDFERTTLNKYLADKWGVVIA